MGERGKKDVAEPLLEQGGVSQALVAPDRAMLPLVQRGDHVRPPRSFPVPHAMDLSATGHSRPLSRCKGSFTPLSSTQTRFPLGILFSLQANSARFPSGFSRYVKDFFSRLYRASRACRTRPGSCSRTVSPVRAGMRQVFLPRPA